METRYKHPRIKHLPWSPGRGREDLVLTDVAHFVGKEVVVTEKMDGENTTFYIDGLHTRSLNWHESRNWVTAYWASICHLIPEGMRICGENMYAKRSLYYVSLPSYFLVHSVWVEDVCLPWIATKKVIQNLGLVMVPEICTVRWSAILEHSLRKRDVPDQEGYVVRLKDGFLLEAFDTSVAKWVREDHVQTEEHWMIMAFVKNRLQKGLER